MDLLFPCLHAISDPHGKDTNAQHRTVPVWKIKGEKILICGWDELFLPLNPKPHKREPKPYFGRRRQEDVQLSMKEKRI